MPDEPVIKPPIVRPPIPGRPVVRQPVETGPVIRPPGVPLRPTDQNPVPIPVKPVIPVVPVVPVGPVLAKGTTLTAGKPMTTTAPTLLVAGQTVPGTYTYSLVVVDDLGVTSKPATVQVEFTAIVIG